MKKYLFLLLLAVTLSAPTFSNTTYACEEECVPVEEATEETPEEDICPVESQGGMVYINVNVMRNAMLQRYVNRLEELGGVYQEGWNRFDVMREIFRIEQSLKEEL